MGVQGKLVLEGIQDMPEVGKWLWEDRFAVDKRVLLDIQDRSAVGRSVQDTMVECNLFVVDMLLFPLWWILHRIKTRPHYDRSYAQSHMSTRPKLLLNSERCPALSLYSVVSRRILIQLSTSCIL